jgi:ribonuclease P protein component
VKDQHTLDKFRRILRSSDYERSRREGRRYHTTHFVVIVNPGGTYSRLGLTVSRKVGNAVCRNQLKRWMRELFRHNYMMFGQIMDISIIAKRNAGDLNHQQLDRELLTVFARLETEEHV